MARKKKVEEPKVEEKLVVEDVVEKPKQVRKKKETIGDTNVDTNTDTIPEKPKVKRTRKKKVVEEQQVIEQPINPLVMNLTPQKEDDSNISVQSLCINVIPEVDSEVIDGKLPDDIDEGFTFEIDDSNHNSFIEMFSEMLGNKTKPTKAASKVAKSPIPKANPLSMDVGDVKKKESDSIKLNLF